MYKKVILMILDGWGKSPRIFHYNLQNQFHQNKSFQEGILCVEKIAGQLVEAIDYGNIPGCTYCTPEIASVGLTEAQAKDKGIDIKVGKFPFSASGKASAGGHKEGFVKVIFDAKYGEWLGQVALQGKNYF